MNDELIAPPSSPIKQDQSKVTSKTLKGRATEGVINKLIGTEGNAKDSIVLMTIAFSLLIGSLITLGLYFRPMYCNSEYFGSLIDDIKASWSIFLPLITLALGYAFGKGR